MKAKEYLALVFDGMAKGLFASLIVGTIIKQFGVYTHIDAIAQLGQMVQYMMGPCIGAGIAFRRSSKPFTFLSAIVVAALGAGTVKLLPQGTYAISIGEPVGALVAALCAIEIGKFVEGRSKFDLLIVPFVCILGGGVVATFASPMIAGFLSGFGKLVNELTLLHPLPMGILLAVVVGITLTLPISSAAICISIGISGLAAGAALAGCCAHMVGFAVISFRENKWSGFFAQSLGTSMVQMPNIVKNPWIALPPILASVVTGPLSTMVFHMQTNSVGAGMGTSGLVGQVTTLSVMGMNAFFPMLLLHFLLPMVISLFVAEIMRKRGMIAFGDLLLS